MSTSPPVSQGLRVQRRRLCLCPECLQLGRHWRKDKPSSQYSPIKDKYQGKKLQPMYLFLNLEASLCHFMVMTHSLEV